jgi:hypothetical protein
MAPKLDLTKNVQRIAARQAQKDDRQPSIDYPISTRAPEPELPAQAGMLSERLQALARQYLGARRRSGEALLEAARWLSEARAEAQHGEWQTFLEATNTSDDTAERLLNIHRQAMQNPQFAEAVRTNVIGQSVAALLAQSSTPAEIVAEVLDSPEPPSVAQVQKKIRQTRQAPATQQPARDLSKVQNPQFADFEVAERFGLIGGPEPPSSALELLYEVADTMAHLELSSHELPAGAATEGALGRIERSVAAIRSILQHRDNTL